MATDSLVGENRDEWQITVALVVIEPVPYHKLVRNIEAHVVRLHKTGPVDLLAKQNADLDAEGATFRQKALSNGV